LWPRRFPPAARANGCDCALAGGQTSLGLKTDYGLWNDHSEAKQIAELEINIRNLSRLLREFDYDKLDPDTKLSYRLFERSAERRIEWFPFSHHGY
jgi:hypothetical protein